MAEIDTFNRYLVGSSAAGLVIANPPPRMSVMKDEEALLLAAWLVSMVGDDELWERTLKAVQDPG